MIFDTLAKLCYSSEIQPVDHKNNNNNNVVFYTCGVGWLDLDVFTLADT